KPRLVIRITSRHVTAQMVEYDTKGDRIITSAHSKELEGYGWKGSTSNTSAAYLTGLICGMKAKEKGAKEAVLDIGLQVASSKIFAALKGVLDSGIEVPHSDEVLPDENRIKGEHVAAHAGLIKDKKIRFSKYLERGLDPTELPKHFDTVVSKIKEDKK
ncbi:50S ribosomal protein L18, partial [archaeon]|nr:50S ribosomal protein L18 [archaeon]